MDEEALTELIDPRKDVDGFHPVNLGRLVQVEAMVWSHARLLASWKCFIGQRLI